ncbi:MAG TPA: molybdenum ABC transporter permease, partial [Desulfomicrobiaceae bacterium]|nr:molybdenum ABC transporter permease [Desulfomicrobiaceae bacterium]
MQKPTLFTPALALLSLPLVLLIVLPMSRMLTQSGPGLLLETIRDPQVYTAIARSLSTSLAAAGISFVFGTPLAYLL